MPGRIKLSTEATVETPPRSSKRQPSLPIHGHAAKRTKPTEIPVARAATGGAPQSSIHPIDDAFRAASPQPNSNAPDTSGAAVKPPKKKQASKPRAKRFTCTYENCNKAFTRPCRLEEHIRSHTGSRPYKCTQDPENCDKSFLRDSHLKAHIKAMHSKEKPYRCSFLIPPGNEGDRGAFGFKRKASEPAGGDGEGGEMKECGARFSTNQHLKRHVESHLKTFPYICKDHPPCSAGFRKKGPLTRHIRSEHLNLQPWACPHRDIDDGSKACAAAFDTKGKLGNHVATQHTGLARRRYICTICAITSPGTVAPLGEPEPNLTTGTTTVDLDRPFPDKTAEDASLLLSLSQPIFPVIQAPPSPRPNPDSLCREGMLGFTTYAELRTHIAHAHPPICQHCGFCAKRQSELRNHVRDKHETSLEERRSWVCGWESCRSQGFTKKSNLLVHTATVHQGLKPFLCSECGKRFGHKAVLARHVAARHTPEGIEKQKRKKANAARILKKKQKQKRTRALSIAQLLTGVGYADSGRNIECIVDECQYRFCRVCDLKKHLGARSAHGFEPALVRELLAGSAVVTEMDGEEEGEGEGGGESQSESQSESGSESESDWSLAGGSEAEGEDDYEIDDGDGNDNGGIPSLP